MSSRQEEKERRKKERLEREQAAAQAAKRKRMAQVVGGALVVLAVAVGAVFAASGGGGSDDDGPSDRATDGVPIPAQQEDDLEEAVKIGGCMVRAFRDEGQGHVSEPLTAENYRTNPPTSGNHNPMPAEDGIYDPGNPPKIENWVHTLEHGRIILMYKRGTPRRRVQQLETLFSESVAGGPDGHHMVLMENNTNMPFAVAAVAWRNSVGCAAFTDRSFDALRAFRDRYVDKAPEQVP